MQQSFKALKPTLYVVATPIGNLKDITYRAVEILNAVDYILAEDTRTSGILLKHYGIQKPMISYHEFNKDNQNRHVIELLSNGKHLALISDAGTPGISDPGYEIIQAIIEAGYHVVSIPGPSAILSALTSSGLIMQPFVFLGFLPRKASDARTTIQSYKYRRETLVIYESPLRILQTLTLLFDLLGDRKIALARELTKAFETIIRTTLTEALTMSHNTKGEYVMVVEGDHASKIFETSIAEHYAHYLALGYSDMDAIKAVAKDRKIPKNDVYRSVKVKA